MPTIHSALAPRARAALTEGARTKASTIKVVDENGVLTLKGTARSQAVRQAAEEIVSSQKGVIRVINELEVAPVDETATQSQAIPPQEHPYIEE